MECGFFVPKERNYFYKCIRERLKAFVRYCFFCFPINMNRPMGSQQEHICLVPLTENSLRVLITEPVPWQLSKDLHYWPVLHKKEVIPRCCRAGRPLYLHPLINMTRKVKVLVSLDSSKEIFKKLEDVLSGLTFSVMFYSHWHQFWNDEQWMPPFW